MIKDVYRFLSRKYQNVFLDYPVDMKPRYSRKNPHRLLYQIIDNNREAYKERVAMFEKYAAEIATIPLKPDPENNAIPHWENGFLPGMDVVVLYGLISELKPKRYIEVGSGNSTKIVHLAKSNHSPDTKIISIDPMPRAEIDELADEIIRKPFEEIDLSFLTDLEKGDILFIDNSHRLLPNSDATVFFLEILPLLKKGVIVHIHDIYLPYDYPQFMCDRAYSEQYALAAFLLANPEKYVTYLPNFFMSADEEIASRFDIFWGNNALETVEKHGGSYWLEIN